MNEADTCRTYVLPKLKSAGWEEEYISEQMVLTPGRIVPIGDRHTRKEGLRSDYTLFIRQNIPIAVVEAKADYAHPAKGLQQAIQYAEMMGGEVCPFEQWQGDDIRAATIGRGVQGRVVRGEYMQIDAIVTISRKILALSCSGR
jgi:hypothetical protein